MANEIALSQYGLLQNRNLWFTEVKGMLSGAANSKDKKDGAWIIEQMGLTETPLFGGRWAIERVGVCG
jgi:hypothetical protein